MIRTGLLTALCLIFSFFFAKAHSPETTPRDTVPAVVVYNAENLFIPKVTYTAEDYSHFIDSLISLDTVPLSLINQMSIYRMLASHEADQLDAVIDSIFESDFIAEPVLNAINSYMAAMHDALLKPTGFAAYVPVSESRYPANAFYESWNTGVPNPHRNNLSTFDTTLHLLLIDTLANCGFVPPIRGVVTSLFGHRYGRNHNGIDLDLEVWDPVSAAFPGVVRVAQYYKGYGRVVVIRHYNGLETIYAHLHRFKVNPGDEVEAGDIIGLGGSSGHSTGSHLHFEIRFQGVPIPPSDIIDFEKFELKTPLVALQRDGVYLKAVSENESGEQKIYEVKQGDYLYKIAQEFGTTVKKICDLNGIRAKSNIYKGQVLVVGT